MPHTPIHDVTISNEYLTFSLMECIIYPEHFLEILC